MTIRSANELALYLALVIGLLFLPTGVKAYRPFESTDADVEDPHQLEIELGVFTHEKTGDNDIFRSPDLVANYGFARNWEVVAEGALEQDLEDNLQLSDPGLFLKGILRSGVLQGGRGPRMAVEAGILLPSTRASEDTPGGEGILIGSMAVNPVIIHLNLGGGVTRGKQRAFALWGVIGELPVNDDLTVAMEFNGESVEGNRPENSVLLGLLWQTPGTDAVIDLGVRHGLSAAAPDWMATVGVTFGMDL